MPIATRKLLIRSPEKETEVEIRLFQPVCEDGVWKCNYEIDWPTQTRKSFAGGIDSVQTLVLALQKIGTELYTSSHHEKSELIWETPGGGYGFFVPKNLRDMLIGDDVDL